MAETKKTNLEEIINKMKCLLSTGGFGEYLYASLIFFGVEGKFMGEGLKLPDELSKLKEVLDDEGLNWCIKNSEKYFEKGNYKQAKFELEFVAKRRYCKEKDLPEKALNLLKQIDAKIVQ